MPKSVITYLIRGDKNSLRKFKRSIRLLRRNFLPWNPADILVFHEDNVTAEAIQAVDTKIRISCAPVDFTSVPATFSQNRLDLRLGGLGYRHMCHFFANDIFLRPELAPYRYMMRMDDDSYIHSKVKENVFEKMHAHDFRYAYRVQMFDAPNVCEGLWDTVAAFFRAHPDLKRGSLEPAPPYRVYYTNFEINDLNWFRGPEWQAYFSAIDKAGGIYRTRWGDAPIRYYGVTGMLPPEKILHVREFHYQHQLTWKSNADNPSKIEMLRWRIYCSYIAFKNRKKR